MGGFNHILNTLNDNISKTSLENAQTTGLCCRKPLLIPSSGLSEKIIYSVKFLLKVGITEVDKLEVLISFRPNAKNDYNDVFLLQSDNIYHTLHIMKCLSRLSSSERL